MTLNNQDKMAENMSKEKFHSTWKTSALDHCKAAQGDERIPLVALLLPLVFLPGSPAESSRRRKSSRKVYGKSTPNADWSLKKFTRKLNFNRSVVGRKRAHNAVVSLEREEPECINGSKVTDGLTKMGMHVHVWRD